MLDSPFVRRVAVSLQLLGLPFEHRPVSVFRTFDEFHAINPVVKAPTLVCDDGTVLMDSTLIIDYAEAVARRSLMPSELGARQRALRIIGLALAACEKAVQDVYEHNLRPAEKQHQPWLDRVDGQLARAYALLEQEISTCAVPADASTLTQADVTTAVVWTFTQALLPGKVTPAQHPSLAAFTAALEQFDVFRNWPHA
jgi:glutathione S-transferase